MNIVKFLKQTRIQTGLRLFFAGLFVFAGSYIAAAVALIFPAFGYNPKLMFVGGNSEEDETILLDKVEKRIKDAVEKASEGAISQKKLDKLIEKLNSEISEMSNAAKAELDKRMKEFADKNEALQKEIKDANDALKTQSEAIKKLTDKGTVEEANKPVTFRKALENSIMAKHAEVPGVLAEKNDDFGKRFSLKDFFTEKGGKQLPTFTLKVAVDMLESNIVGANVNTVRLTELDPKRVGIPLTIYPHVMDVFYSKTISRPFMSILVVYTYTDGSATKVEGAASGQSSFLLKTVEFKSFYIATNFVLSDETLDDLNEALDEIAIVAPDKILDKIDTKILGATGDDATDIAGILTASKNTAFDVTLGFGAASVDNANFIDAILSAKLQAEKNKYKPNAVYVNPTQLYLMSAEKNSFLDSRLDRRITYDANGVPTFIGGLRIIQSTAIVVNTFIVFDNAQTMIGKRADMTMEIGYNGTDLTEGQKTVVIKVRLAFGVRDKAAIIYCSDITAAVAALEK